MDYRRWGEIGYVGGRPVFQESLRSVAVDGASRWYLAGDRYVRIFGDDGQVLQHWTTQVPAWSIAVDATGHVWAGGAGQIEVFSAEGKQLDLWQDAERFGLVTAIGFVGEDVLVADARSRWIHRYSADRRLLNHIGDRHRKGGFHIPNGVVDFQVDLDGSVVVANPDMHRVERYRPDGEPLGYFGRFGQQDPAGFPGCCNPTNVALGPSGEVVVSEKAGPRVKVYDPAGELMAVVTADADFALEAKNMDLAVSGDGRIGVADPVARQVVVFAPAGEDSGGGQIG